MKRILFLSKGEQSSSTRYRAVSYFPALRRGGWSVAHLDLHQGPAGKWRILRAAREADVVVLLRHGLSFPFLQLLRGASRRLVFDFDDAIFLKSSGAASLVRGKRFDRTVAVCDGVWAGNRYLAEHARGVNPATIVLPTAVDMDRYRSDVPKPHETVDLVWIGSSSTRKYLEELQPTLERAAALEPRLRLKIIADFSLSSAVLPIVAVPWRADTEAAELASSHLGIAPMRDDPWTRGKCALKVLQYMASRLPVVSSRAGANAEIVQTGRTGFLVDSTEEWVEAILALAKAEEQRRTMGDAGYAICAEGYSLDRCAALMLAELEAASG
jgi:glycosyltransferase involved in cell wall biosynthesis